jgi:hypothetical protein
MILNDVSGRTAESIFRDSAVKELMETYGLSITRSF